MGDPVFGVTDQGAEGAYAEKIAINAAIITTKPDRLSHAEATALGLTSLTALTAIEDTAHLQTGQTILIQVAPVAWPDLPCNSVSILAQE